MRHQSLVFHINTRTCMWFRAEAEGRITKLSTGPTNIHVVNSILYNQYIGRGWYCLDSLSLSDAYMRQ